MFLDELPAELLTQVFLSLHTITDASNLSISCRRMRAIFNKRKLEILGQIAEVQYGPLDDAIQLVTQNSSQPAHQRRSAPWSLALLKQVVEVGKIGQSWSELYPARKWKQNFEDRRLLTPAEEYLFRRALYRLWLYSRAFHTVDYPRNTRLNPLIVYERTLLLHNWNNLELAEMMDVAQTVRDVVQNSICPSNGTVQRKFRKRFPDLNHQLLFNMPFQSMTHHSMTNPANEQYYGHIRSFDATGVRKYIPTKEHEPGSEGWGDDISHYYVVEDMMKLDPGQILWLRMNKFSKLDVEEYVTHLGPWFENNGETFGQTLEFVVTERGLDLADFMAAVRDGEAGVVRTIPKRY